MGETTVGVVIEGATGRLGTTQHLRSMMAIRSEGGLALANGDRLVPEPVLLGRNPVKAGGSGGSQWRPQMEHRSRYLSRRPRDRDLFRRERDRRAAGARRGGARRRQARLSRKAARRNTGGCAGSGAPRRARRTQKRCRAGQIVPARAHQIAQALRGRFLRPGAVDPARFRLVGIRRHALPGTAAELELSQGHRRRAYPRYVRALALHFRSPAG